MVRQVWMDVGLGCATGSAVAGDSSDVSCNIVATVAPGVAPGDVQMQGCLCTHVLYEMS